MQQPTILETEIQQQPDVLARLLDDRTILEVARAIKAADPKCVYPARNQGTCSFPDRRRIIDCDLNELESHLSAGFARFDYKRLGVGFRRIPSYADRTTETRRARRLWKRRLNITYQRNI